MASVVTSCAPCVFGAAQFALLSFPYDVQGSLDVSLVTLTTTFRNGSTSTTVSRTTLGGPSGGTSYMVGTSGTLSSMDPVIISDATPTWTTLGTTLTYPTTYVQYLDFQGAAVAPQATACAETLPVTSLSLPNPTNPASYIYPQDNATALPAGLLSFLDADGGIPSQLAGDGLTDCAPLSVLITAVGSGTSVTQSVSEVLSSATETTSETIVTGTSLSTSVTTSTGETTITTTTSPTAPEATSSVATVTAPVTVTSATAVELTTEQTRITTQTLTNRPALILNTISNRALVTEVSTEVTPLGVSLEDSSLLSSTDVETSTLTNATTSTDITAIGGATSDDTTTASSTTTSTSTITLTPGTSSDTTTPLVPIPISSAVSGGPGPYSNGSLATGSMASTGFPSGTIGGNMTSTGYPISYTGAASQVKGAPGWGALMGFALAVLGL